LAFAVVSTLLEIGVHQVRKNIVPLHHQNPVQQIQLGSIQSLKLIKAADSINYALIRELEAN
jgi:hypothetical protein